MDSILKSLARHNYFNVRVPPRFLERMGDLVARNRLSRDTYLAVVRHDLKSHIIVGLGVSLNTVVQVQGEQIFRAPDSTH